MIVFLIPLVVLTMLAVVATVRERRQALETLHWPAVDATITWSSLAEEVQGTGEEAGRVYISEIRYAYVVEGQRYEGTRVFIGEHWFPLRRSARRIVDAYPPGTRVRAYINPLHPGESVLRSGDQTLRRNLVMVATLVLVTGIVAVMVWREP